MGSLFTLTVLCALCVNLLAGTVQAQDPFLTDDVTRLVGVDMFKEAVSDGRIHFVKFYLPNQGESKRLAPLWKDLMAHKHIKDDDRISISIVDCSNEENLNLCERMASFPLFKVFLNGRDKGTYKGALELENMRNYMLGAAHYYQPRRGNWFVEAIKAYFKILRQAYSSRSHSSARAHQRRVQRDEF